MLGTFSFEVSEAGINRILEVLGVEHSVEVPPLGIDARIFGSISLGGSVRISNFRISIADTTATGSAQAAPAFTLTVDLPGRGPDRVPLDMTFRIPEVIAVGLKHVGPKAFLVLSDLELSIDPKCPPVVPKRAWNLVLSQVGRLKTRIVQAIEAELRRRPIELFDLTDHAQLRFPGDKMMPTRLSFEALEFRKGSICCSIRIDEAEAQETAGEEVGSK